MTERFFAVNQVSFSKNDLPPEGAAHNKALQLTVKCEDYYVKRVMLDGDSGVDICPLSTLQRMEIGTGRIRPNNVCVRAFDGIKRDTLEEIDLILTIGPVEFEVTFQVLDIDTSYNFLLGRPWIHGAGVVPSTLHQMVKFEYEDREIMYEEGSPCPQPFLSNASIMVAKEMIRRGFKPGEGLGKSLQGITEPITLPSTKKLFGIGFHPTPKDEDWAKKRKNEGWKLPQPLPHLYETFVRPKYIEEEDDEAFTAEEIEEICGSMREMLYETHMVQLGEGTSTVEVLYMGPNAKLQNWEATPFPVRQESGYNNAALNNMTCLRTSLPDPNELFNCEIMNQGPEYDEEEAFREINRELEHFENKPKPNLNDTELINLGTLEEIRETKLSIHTDGTTRDAIIQPLFEFKNVFAWSYDDMPGLGVDLVVLMDEEDAEKTAFTTPWDEEINTIGVVSKDALAWKMFFDGAVNAKSVGIGAILISPTGQHYPSIARLYFFCTNNTAEYEACIMGMNMVIDQDVEDLLIMWDSDLTIRQAQGEWETRDIKLITYRQHVEDLSKRFKSIQFRYILRRHNELADALATLASMLPYPEIEDNEWVKTRLEKLTLIDEKRMAAVCHGQLYQQRMAHAYNKKVRPRNFEVGQLVLRRILPHHQEVKGKFAPNWKGPYIIRKILPRGALYLGDIEGNDPEIAVNADAVKRYYV
ncbi:uncharacterized protein [Nicotiana sylvestris]|uniref:uncharacterized protein n=1 Tax=Nicotiana sylvestris TaxID=4096 RepID=UPI00388CDC49